ncbi:hypothetical protein CBS101457_006460 [Exobasidium rhododendri]|nr:hypothetical protein CBS101457_006460 [Exobasidium rhododendri]
MVTTSEGTAKKLPKDAQEEACTIRVELTRPIRIGAVDHPSGRERNMKIHLNPEVHEDSKLAMLELQAVPGAQIVGPDNGHCYCKIVPNPDAIKDVVIFKYLPRALLSARGLVKGTRARARDGNDNDDDDDDDDEVVEDTHRTQRSASLRRRRETAAQSLRREHIKRETTIKSEGIGEKDDAERAHEPVDLTYEGDYIPPSRKIGDTIVLGEDSEDSSDSDGSDSDGSDSDGSDNDGDK